MLADAEVSWRESLARANFEIKQHERFARWVLPAPKQEPQLGIFSGPRASFLELFFLRVLRSARGLSKIYLAGRLRI